MENVHKENEKDSMGWKQDSLQGVLLVHISKETG